MLSTFNRSDTLLGVCEALGQDVGFNANWLRIPLATGLLWSPAAMVALYLGLGVMVAVARLLTPVKTVAPLKSVETPVAEAANDAAVEFRQAA